LKLVKEFEVPGYGPEKKQAILDIIGSLYDAILKDIIGLVLGKEKLLLVAGNVIDIVVKVFNVIGIFKKEKPAENPT